MIILFVLVLHLIAWQNLSRDLERFTVNYSSSSFVTHVNLISLVILYLSKLLFSGFAQLKGNFVRGQNNSK